MRKGGGLPAGMPSIPGMPPMLGGGKFKAQQPPKKKSKSGNPAKRAAEQG